MKELLKKNPLQDKDFNYQLLSPLEKFKYNLCHFGFMIPKDAKFYKVKENNIIGMNVGSYVHSCHVETNDIEILFHIDGKGNHYIKEYWDCWNLEEIK